MTSRWRLLRDRVIRGPRNERTAVASTEVSAEAASGPEAPAAEVFALEQVALNPEPVRSLLPTSPDGEETSLFRNRNFVALWAAQGLSQTINTGLQFVLLILIVERFESSIAGSGLIIAMAAPPVVFGLISGIVVDRFDKRSVLIGTNAVRGVVTALLIFADVSVASIYAVAFVTATMGQFYLPAASAAVPSFVPSRQLLAANSVFQLTTVTSQLLGMVMVAPLMLKLFGFDASYIFAGVVILSTVPMLLLLPQLHPERSFDSESWRHRARMVPGELRAAWTMIRADRITTLAMLQLSTGGMLLFMFALLVPRFVKDVLEKNPDDSVFIFWPVGLGAILALRLLTVLGRRYSPTGIVTVGLFGLAVAIAAMGAVDFLVDFLQDEQPWGRLGPDQVLGESLLVVVVVILAFPMGIAYALVNAPAQTVLHERAPADMRGRVFSAQLMLANAISMFALLFIGVLTDAVGVAAVLFVVGVATLAMAVFSVYMRRLAHQEAQSSSERPAVSSDE